MTKKTQGYGFDVRGTTPLYRNQADAAGEPRRPQNGANISSYGYDPSKGVKSAKQTFNSPQSRAYTEAHQNLRAGKVQNQSQSGSARMSREETGTDWAFPSVTPHLNRPAQQTQQTSYARTAQRQTQNSQQAAYARTAQGQTRSAQGGQNNASQRRQSGISPSQMSPEQRKRYEAAYAAKHGVSPYGAARRDPAADARAEAERERNRIAYEKEMARKARASAEAEKKRREEYERRRAEAERQREAEMRRREAAERRRKAQLELEKRKNRRLFFKRFKFHAVVVAAAFLVCAAVVGVIVYSSFWGREKDASDHITYYYGNEKVTVKNADITSPPGDTRINFSKLSEMMGFYTVSVDGSFKFVVSEGSEDDPSSGTGRDEYIVFSDGSPSANVNGTSINLSSNTLYSGGNVWVSDDIMDAFDAGIKYTVSGKKVMFEKEKLLDESGKEQVDENGKQLYAAVRLKYSLSSDLTDVDLDNIYGPSGAGSANGTASAVTFKSDLSEYEQYMNPEDSTPYLLLVNKETTIDENFVPENLTDVKDTRTDGRETQKMVLCAEKALEAMFIELRAEGYTDLSVTSAYRSFERQSQLFNSYINQEMQSGLSREDATKKVLTYSAAPGTSEHQSGLCCDMHNLPAADQAFANKDAYKWLKENCWKFGFIIRFPEDKEDITGYEFEPWHYRFVGRYSAEKIHENGMCLEEYLKTIG